MIKAVIFDVDGVVVKSKNDVGEFLWSLHIERDLGMSLECRREIFTQDWIRVLRGELDTMEHLQFVFKKCPQLSITPEQFAGYWLSHDSNVDMKVIECVKNLRLPKYLGTNQDHLRTQHLRELVGEYFDGVFASCEMKCIKPDELFFKNIERQLNLQPHELMLVDDEVKNIVSAKRCGWEGHLYEGDEGFLLKIF